MYVGVWNFSPPKQMEHATYGDGAWASIRVALEGEEGARSETIYTSAASRSHASA